MEINFSLKMLNSLSLSHTAETKQKPALTERTKNPEVLQKVTEDAGTRCGSSG